MKAKFFSLLVVCIITLASVIPALAAEPFVWTASYDNDHAYVASCDDFRILEAYVADWTIHDYYDAEGNLDRQVGHVKASGTLYNSRNPEYFIEYNTNTYKHIYEGGYRSKGTDTIVGTYYKLTLPGYGDIFMEIGRMIIAHNGDILFKAGQGDYSSGDIQAICAYLAGP